MSNLPARFEESECWELFYQCIDHVGVEFKSYVPVKVTQSQIEGIAVRLIADQRLGFSSTTDLSQIEEAIDAARSAARLGLPTRIEFPPPAHYVPVESFDPQVASMVGDQLKDWIARDIQRGHLSRVRNLTVVAERDVITRRIFNHRGLDVADQSTILKVKVCGCFSDGFDLLTESEISRQFDIDLEKLVERFRRRYDRCRNSKLARMLRGRLPAIISENSMRSLLGELERMLVRIVNLSDRGLLKRLRDLQLASPTVTLIDKGTGNWLPGSASFDDEGVAKQNITIIERGQLKTPILDLYPASLLGEQPTGHAWRRGVNFRPVARFNYPCLSPGSDTREQILSDLREGLFIDQLRNIELGGKALGDFTAKVKLGFSVRNGSLSELVRDYRIAGNLFRLLGDHLIAIADCPESCSRGSVPAVMVKEIEVQT